MLLTNKSHKCLGGRKVMKKFDNVLDTIIGNGNNGNEYQELANNVFDYSTRLSRKKDQVLFLSEMFGISQKQAKEMVKIFTVRDNILKNLTVVPIEPVREG